MCSPNGLVKVWPSTTPRQFCQGAPFISLPPNYACHSQLMPTSTSTQFGLVKSAPPQYVLPNCEPGFSKHFCSRYAGPQNMSPQNGLPPPQYVLPNMCSPIVNLVFQNIPAHDMLAPKTCLPKMGSRLPNMCSPIVNLVFK